jgi:broad specificity phosphatase PhoE
MADLLQSLPGEFTLFLGRHATPDWSRKDIPYHVPPGPQLVEKGRLEAERLGEFFRASGVVHVLASPLERAWRTGCIAGGIARATIELNDDLAEHRPEEKDVDVLARAQRAFALGAYLGAAHGPTALISHGSPVLILLKWLGLPAEIIERSCIYDGRNILPPAGAWQVRREAGELALQLAFVPGEVVLETA